MLYDDMLVSFARPERHYGETVNFKDPYSRSYIHHLRGKISHAHRFVLSDEVTKTVEEASLLDLPRVGYLYSQARVPYDLTWIEWSTKPRMEVEMAWRKKVGLDGEPRLTPDSRAAFLIERDTRFSDRDSIYRVLQFSQNTAGHSALWPIGLVYDPSGHEVGMALDKDDKEVVALLERHIRPWMPPLVFTMGPGYMSKNAGIWDETKEAVIVSNIGAKVFNYIQGSATYSCGGPFGRWVLAQTKLWPDKAGKLANVLVEESAGDLRFLAALLGVINLYRLEAGEKTMPASYQAKHERIVGGRKVPYYEYRTLAIKVAIPNTYNRVKKLTASMIHKKRHEVRGHYRHYIKYEKTVWVRPHQRGDARIGFVDKDYVLESAPEK